MPLIEIKAQVNYKFTYVWEYFFSTLFCVIDFAASLVTLRMYHQSNKCNSVVSFS